MMKKAVKKLFVMAMAVTVAATSLPVMSVEAAVSAPKEYTVYRDTTRDYLSYHSLTVTGLKKSTKIYPSSTKSSKKSVLVPSYMEKSSSVYSYESTYYDNDGKVSGKPSKSSSSYYYAYVGFKVKKAGKANLSYKIGSKTFTTKVTAKAYTNPIKTAKIAGIKNGSSTNLASKLKKENYTNLKMKSNKNDAVVQMVANKGWKITNISVSNYANGTSYSLQNYSNGVSSKKLNIGNVKKTDTLYVEVRAENTTNGAYQYCYFHVNQDY